MLVGRKDDLIARLREHVNRSSSSSSTNSVSEDSADTDVAVAIDLSSDSDDLDKENDTLNEFNKLTEEIEMMKAASSGLGAPSGKRKLLSNKASFAPVVLEEMEGYTLE